MTLTELTTEFAKLNANLVPFSFSKSGPRMFIFQLDGVMVAAVEIEREDYDFYYFTIYNFGSKVTSSYPLALEVRETPRHLALRLYHLLQEAI